MNKTDILSILREMQLNWTECIAHIDKESFEQIVKLRNCEEGFCHWLWINASIYRSEKKEILAVLFQDFTKYWCEIGYWYDTFYEYGFINSRNRNLDILQTRLDHINRTIARLEKQTN